MSWSEPRQTTPRSQPERTCLEGQDLEILVHHNTNDHDSDNNKYNDNDNNIIVVVIIITKAIIIIMIYGQIAVIFWATWRS